MNKTLTITEFARMGGIAKFKKYGKEHYRMMSRRRWDKKKKEAENTT